jgi:multiple sugar transport system permease protein
MLTNPKAQQRIGDILVTILLSLGAVTMLFPFAWMISTSLKEQRYIFTLPPQWIPDPILWHKYIEVWEKGPLLYGFMNSTIVALSVIIVGTFTSSLAAFAFSKMRFPHKEKLFMFLLGTMMIPYAAVMIPQFVMFSNIGWVDTLWPLILPGLFGNVAMIFFLRQYLTGVPTAIIDAAKIDGCSFFGIYWRIVLPSIKPAIAAHVVMWFMGIWNDYLGPVIYLTSPRKMTIQPVIALFNSYYASQNDYALIMAASVISMMPVIFIFVFFQRYFIESLVISGMKE